MFTAKDPFKKVGGCHFGSQKESKNWVKLTALAVQERAKNFSPAHEQKTLEKNRNYGQISCTGSTGMHKIFVARKNAKNGN